MPRRRGLSPVRRHVVAQALSIAAAVVPFGFAFGVLCVEAQIPWPGTVVFAALVFSGGSQFAAVGVLAEGGSALAATVAGVLVAVRMLVYGVVMAPDLRGRWWHRLLLAHLVIDETVAVASGQPVRADRRFGFLVTGLTLFVVWNLSCLAGSLLLAGSGDLLLRWGIDAAIPASFLALLWPRLGDPVQRRVAAAGLAIALVTVPVLAVGIPIVAAALAVLVGGRALLSGGVAAATGEAA